MEIKPYIDYLLNSKIQKDKGLELLKGDDKLSADEKNLIYAYCYPRQLLDRELPQRFRDYRSKHDTALSIIDSGETTLIVEAGRTQQYGRFIKHLMHAFGDPRKIFPIEGVETEECSICGNILMEKDLWTDRKGSELELAYGSTESGIILCKKCLLNLMKAKEIFDSIDPGFLDWTKRGAWDKLNPLKRA